LGKWNRAQVLASQNGILHLAWRAPDGQMLNKQLPEGSEHIRWLEVEIFSNSQQKWLRAQVIKVANGILTVSCTLPDGRVGEKHLSFGHEHIRPAGVEDPGPWLDAAANFQLNVDFDVTQALQACGKGAMDCTAVFNIMKKESAGKKTIQALGDKIILNQMLTNLNVPQMPMYFAARREVDRKQVYSMVESWEQNPQGGDAFDVVMKPTHLSNGEGAVICDKDRWDNEEGGWNKEKLFQHISKFLNQRAQDNESEALKSLIPGFIVQPRYRSVLDFKTPLEVRVVTLWGKTRLGIWWWGKGIQEERRNTWLIRHPKNCGELGPDDDWEILHEHTGVNQGFEEAVRLLKRAMPSMAAAAEGISTAVGAPFLRSDFFVGSNQWGVRLNEVAYGSGTDYRQRPVGAESLVDDGPTIARILQEGFNLVRSRAAPEAFLSRLGVDGARYETMTVSPLQESQRMALPQEATSGFEQLAQEGMPSPMPNMACMTMFNVQAPGGNYLR
jgi:hypothetical protein